MPEVQPKFISRQNEFSAYIRDPDNNPAPLGIKEQRMTMYRDLFFNNINSFISSNFPVLNKILKEQEWLDMIQDFFSRHASKTPYFSEIPEEFLYYLQNERLSNNQDPPFLLELAHYEWVEMNLNIAREEVIISNNISIEQLKNSQIQLGPLAMVLAYQYPVHQLSGDFQPQQPPVQQTFLIAYRTVEYDVRFLEINPMTYRLLQLIQENESLKTKDHLARIATESIHPNMDVVINGGLQILDELRRKGIINVI